MAQGIMTGIGFLGAGVIMKEGLSVRGLTTAASIWITAAIGILVGIGFVPYSPLGRGFLTGRFSSFDDLPADDFRRRQPRFQGENFQKNLDLVRHVEDVASRKGCTPAELVLAWLLHQGDDIVPIPGTKRVAYLEENVGALGVTLTARDLERIDAVFPKGVAAGERYLEGGMATVNR
jgi:diketogulonate reductase-like aldo/keto reductase